MPVPDEARRGVTMIFGILALIGLIAVLVWIF